MSSASISTMLPASSTSPGSRHSRSRRQRGGMNEAETRAELIDPALRAAGWGVVADTGTPREDLPGPHRRRRPARQAGDRRLRAHLPQSQARGDRGQGGEKPDTEGVGQAKAYAESCRRASPFPPTAGASTGSTWRPARRVCRGAIRRRRIMGRVFRSRTNGATFRRRAIRGARRHLADALLPAQRHRERCSRPSPPVKQRILLTLATGTGKTAIAFQIAWALFQSRWNLSDASRRRRPRILFLADRNILADQAYNVLGLSRRRLARVKPDEIRKKGRVPKNAGIFFTIFQTFMSGTTRTASPRPISASIRRTSSISSSSTSAIAAAPTMKATGAAFSNISRRRCSSA